MSIIDTVQEQLSKPTFIFGIPLWVFAGIGLGLFILLILWFICCCCCCRRSKSTKTPKHPTISSNEKKIHKIENFSTSSTNIPTPDHQSVLPPNPNVPEIKIDIGKTEHQDDVGRPVGSRHWSHRYREGLSREDIGLDSMDAAVAATAPKEEVGHLQWGRLFTLRELKDATNNFSEDYNMIGEGNYGIVYRGVLSDNTPVAVKSLFDNNRDRAGKDFQFEVEAVGNIRHKNLLKLLGYCVEGASRMLVYEYLENGNLNQWLHKDVTQVSPLSWGIRMNIILGTVKALTYLHEGLEPKIVHRDVKSCNILLDRKWNPKVSDFGFAKLLSSEMSHVTTRVMGTYGYVAPEYACTGLLNERSDVYSFGVLVMEIVTGRSPEEMDLVDWLKRMIKKQRFDEIADPKLPEPPSSKALKRVLVIALQCVDPEALLRPTMGQVMHMLESDNFPDKLQELQASRSCR